MNEDELLKLFVTKENTNNLYAYKIWDKSIFSVLRPYIRREFLIHNGINVMPFKKDKNKKALLLNVATSFAQLIKICFSRKKYTNIIFSFPRIEKVDEFYIDKFTDPLIALTNLKHNSIIFEFSVGGVHKKPRIHNNMIVYRDFIDFFGFFIAKLTSWILPVFYKKTINSFYATLEEVFPYKNIKKKIDYERFLSFCVRVNLYKFLYKKLGVKQIFGVSRINLMPQIFAAKECNIPIFEFQHGITYGETSIYSGKIDNLYTPDYFLSFGNIENKSVYGIEPNKIINIGWAFTPFIRSLNIGKTMSDFDILVISESAITNKICKLLVELAKTFNNYKFHLRLHPQENISQQNINVISKQKNIVLQNNKINSNIVISWFKYIMGENSTVLYEAVSIGKKVACLELGGLQPKFLNPKDQESFYIIKDFDDFKDFLKPDNYKKNNISIYSEFKGNQFEFFN